MRRRGPSSITPFGARKNSRRALLSRYCKCRGIALFRMKTGGGGGLVFIFFAFASPNLRFQIRLEGTH